MRERVLLSSQTQKKETNTKEKSERDEHFLWCETNNEREKRKETKKENLGLECSLTKKNLSLSRQKKVTQKQNRVKIKNVVIVIDTTDDESDGDESTNANEKKKTKRESNHFESFFFFFVFFFAF